MNRSHIAPSLVSVFRRPVPASVAFFRRPLVCPWKTVWLVALLVFLTGFFSGAIIFGELLLRFVHTP